MLVSGAGAVGLFTTLALRELTPAGRITVVAKHSRQRELARLFGATDVALPGRGVALGPPLDPRVEAGHGWTAGPTRSAGELLLGGVDVAIDAVGLGGSLDPALRSTRAGGRVVLSGMPAAGADLTPAWFRELEVAGTYAARGDDFDTALRLAGEAPLDGVVGGRYPLHRWREALDHAQSAGRLGTVKVCFDVRSTS